MSTISVSELKRKPAKQWRKAAQKGELIVTSNGMPVAMMLGIEGDSLEAAQSTIRGVRALQAQAALQSAAELAGASALSMAEIDSEISAVRRARRRK